MTGLDKETLDLTLEAVREFAADNLPDEKLLELDAADEFPVDVVRAMCGDGLGIQLLFIPEDYEGMGGGAFDVYRVCEEMAKVDLGVATGVLATFLGSDPIVFGGTPAQQKHWMTRVALEGLLMAYCATEPEAGSDLGALKSTAEPVTEGGKVVGYRLSGAKQWISNGGYADLYTFLAMAPGGPSWFVVERETEGVSWGAPEDKHGIRASNTAAVHLDGVYVDADRLIGGSEGQGLRQAQAVFGYTRLMVAAFGLGAGWAALDRAVPYSAQRIQAGSPLSQKQGYTHKLIVPHAARLEAARAYIEETAERIDSGGGQLNTEGAISKYMASEAGNLAAEAAIQAFGGYGYTREYMVEKIKRDVRITTIYEGTSEIMEMTIGRDRWQMHLKTRGRDFHQEAEKLEALAAAGTAPVRPEAGVATAALALHALAEVFETARIARLTRNQHLLFRFGELAAYAECAGSFVRRVARAAEDKLPEKADRRFDLPALAALSRIFAREAALKVASEGLRWVCGAGGVDPPELEAFSRRLGLPEIHLAQAGLLEDMNLAADAIYGRG